MIDLQYRGPDDVPGSMDIEQKLPTEPATGLRRLGALWPWAWFALTGVAATGWLIALCWAGFAFVRWIVG